MKNAFLKMLFLASLCLACTCGAESEEFVFGVVFEPHPDTLDLDISLMEGLGVKYAKFWVDWSSIQRKYNTDSITWDWWDRVISKLTENGISPVPLICDATTAPFLKNGARIAPSEEGVCEELCNEIGCLNYCGIGRENYIHEAGNHAFLFAERYKDKIKLFNIENELNWTCIHVTVAKWRVGKEWCDQQFLKALIKEIVLRIKEANPSAETTMNFNVHHPLFMEQTKVIGNPLDIIGIGAYPNYLSSKPELGYLLQNYVMIMRAYTGKEVMVMETGYPSGPTDEGYSETLQANYIEDSVNASITGGAKGFFYFKLRDPKVDFEGIKRVEKYWGLVDEHFIPKPSFYRYKKIIKEMNESALNIAKRLQKDKLSK